MVSYSKLEPSLLLLLGFLITVAYIPGWIGASISTGWFALFVLVPVLICFYEINITNIHKLGIIIINYCVLTLAWTYNFNYGIFNLAQLIILSCVFCLGSALNDLRPILKGVAIGLGVSGIIAIAQYYFDFGLVFTHDGGAAGLFVNKNIFAETSVVVLISLIIFKLWWYIPVTLPGIILIHSRAAILTLIILSLFWLWTKSKTAVLSVLAFASVGFVYYLNERGIDPSTLERFKLWVDTARGFKLFGNGIGSYEILYPLYAINIDTVLSRPKYAHNDLLQWIFEFGIGTILLIPLIWYLLISKQTEKYIIYAIGIISCFSFPLHVPLIAFIGFLVAGYITRFDDPIWNFGFCWRSILFKRFKTE